MNDCGFTWTTSEKLVPALSLRDKFAMAALTGLLASPIDRKWSNWRRMADDSYHIADAMMEAREK
jgi:hypothetical protein